MITWENYEEYMMMHADGELNPAEEQALMAFVNDNPELKKELAAYTMTKLVPDTVIVFENKESLLKTEDKRRVIGFPMWQRYGIAAGVAAILFISFYKFGGTHNELAMTKPLPGNQVAVTPGSDTGLHNHASQNVVAVNNNTTTTDPQRVKNSVVAVAQVEKRPGKTKTVINNPTQLRHNKPTDQIAETSHNDFIDKMNPSGMKEFPNTGIAAALPVVKEIATPPVVNEASEEKKTFLTKLSVDDLKKQGIETVATALVNGFDKISAVRQEIVATDINIKVVKRRLVISF